MLRYQRVKASGLDAFLILAACRVACGRQLKKYAMKKEKRLVLVGFVDQQFAIHEEE